MKINRTFRETEEQPAAVASDRAKWLQNKAHRDITASTNAISACNHGWYQKVVMIISLIVAFEYSACVIAGITKVRENKGGNQAHGTRQIPENTRRVGQGKLQNPGTDTPNSQAGSGKLVVPGNGAATMNPSVVKTPLVTREPLGQKLPPLMTREEEGSHHAHHQSQTCDEGSSKQGCMQHTPVEQDLMVKKLRKE